VSDFVDRDIDLDHVAIATRDVGPIIAELVGTFGSRVLYGGMNFGFRAMQLACGDLRIELIEPHNIEQNDFLERFLVANGEGPHHLTFKTDDIEKLLVRIGKAGYHPVGVNIDNPFWREAFIHPREAGGTVVQVAQSDFSELDFGQMEIPDGRGPGQWWPDPPDPDPSTPSAILRRVVVTTDEMQRALGLYDDVLGGERVGWDEGFVELGWAGGGRIRLEIAAGRAPGIDRIEWDHDGPRTETTVGGTTMVRYPSSSASS
jgi:catechol 2,3-dioxygenase-like lactoylglutathione lyase family enzyme